MLTQTHLPLRLNPGTEPEDLASQLLPSINPALEPTKKRKSKLPRKLEQNWKPETQWSPKFCPAVTDRQFLALCKPWVWSRDFYPGPTFKGFPTLDSGERLKHRLSQSPPAPSVVVREGFTEEVIQG